MAVAPGVGHGAEHRGGEGLVAIVLRCHTIECFAHAAAPAHRARLPPIVARNASPGTDCQCQNLGILQSSHESRSPPSLLGRVEGAWNPASVYPKPSARLHRRSRHSPRTPPSSHAFAASRTRAYATRSKNGAVRRMVPRLPKVLGTLVAALLMWSPHIRGQESKVASSDSGYTDEQSEAIDRVDELMGRLQAMQWGPDVVSSISGLGATACHYSHELGVRVFDTAYSVVATSDFDLEDEWSMHALSRLSAAASRCDPSFRDRTLIRDVPESELLVREQLDAIFKNVATDPHEAAKFAHGVASQVHILPGRRQLAFVEGLWKLRQQLPAEADQLFRDALSVAATAGTTVDLFALGNYVFGPKSEVEGEIGVVPLSNAAGEAYVFSEVRLGFPNELAKLYVGAATDMLLERWTAISQDPRSFALATQLAAWAETDAPEHASALDSLLASQTDFIGNHGRVAEFREQLDSIREREDSIDKGDFSSRLNAEMESEIDEETKAFLRLTLFANRIRAGQLSGAADLLDDMGPELRRPLSDMVELKRTVEAIANDDLEDATTRVAGLKNSLHQVLGALSLASAYWNRSRDAKDGSAEDRDAADRALQLAIGAVDSVPDQLRLHARIAAAAVLAKYDQREDALRVLELGFQGLTTDRASEETEESVLLITGSLDGGFFAEIRHDGEDFSIGDLNPPNLNDANFVWAIYHLSLSPEVDLNRLDAIASKAVDVRLRAQGLATVAAGALTRAFETKTD